MKLYEKVILIIMAATGLLISLSSLFNFKLFPFISLIPFGIFLIILAIYGFKMTDRKKKALIFIYIFISLINYLFSIQHWQGQMLLEIMKGLVMLALSIYWFIDINKLNIEMFNKKVKWVSILFMCFLITQLLFIKISLVVFIALLIFILQLLKDDDFQLENNDYQMTKIALVTSVFIISIHLKALLIFSMI